MKHFILGILALSAGLQSANAMEEHEPDNNSGTKIIKVLEIVPPFEEDIDKINVLKDQNKIEIELKMPKEFVMREVISIDIHPVIDNQNIKVGMDYECYDYKQLVLAAMMMSRKQNEHIDILTSHQPLITNIDNAGAGLREIELYNAGLIGELSFAYNLPLSNVTIYTHNEGLVIDKFAFGNCRTIDTFSIYGDIKYISDYAFADTKIKKMKLDRRPYHDVYQSLANNKNIEKVDFDDAMSEDEDY